MELILENDVLYIDKAKERYILKQMTEINIKKKVKFGKAVRILECNDLLAIESLVRQHYEKEGGWVVTKKPELSGIFKKHYRMELMRKYK